MRVLSLGELEHRPQGLRLEAGVGEGKDGVVAVVALGGDLAASKQGAVVQVVDERHAGKDGGMAEDLRDDGHAVGRAEGDRRSDALETVHCRCLRKEALKPSGAVEGCLGDEVDVELGCGGLAQGGAASH